MTPMHDQSPIFLIGAARSGTKFLRGLFASSEMTVTIPYDVNYVWRYGNEALTHDELPASSITPVMRKHICRNLSRLAGLKKADDRIMIEKTVSNTLRVPFIDAIYPNARYVHLIRDGRAVVESAMRQWQAPPDTGSLIRKLRQMPLSNYRYVMWFGFNLVKGIATGRGGGQVWGPRYMGIMEDVTNQRPLVEICSKQWQRSVDQASKDLEMINPARVFTLRYDQLVAEDVSVMELIKFAGLNDSDRVMQSYRSSVRTDTDAKWQSGLDGNQKDIMMSVIGPALRKYGFN